MKSIFFSSSSHKLVNGLVTMTGTIRRGRHKPEKTVDIQVLAGIFKNIIQIVSVLIKSFFLIISFISCNSQPFLIKIQTLWHFLF